MPLVLSQANEMTHLRVIICLEHPSAATLAEWHVRPVAQRIQLITYDDVIIRGKVGNSRGRNFGWFVCLTPCNKKEQSVRATTHPACCERHVMHHVRGVF